jgi:hypothetical protein
MPDVFVSYASEDRVKVATLVRLFGERLDVGESCRLHDRLKQGRQEHASLKSLSRQFRRT